VFISQILGSMASAAVVSALFPGPLNVSTTLGGGSSIVQGLFIEMFLTAELVFCIFMLAAEKHKGTFLAPVGIGLSLFIAELSGTSEIRIMSAALLIKIRCLLHRWFPQPCTLFRSLRSPQRLPRLPLDLLARSGPWFLRRCRILPLRKGAGVRDREPWTRL